MKRTNRRMRSLTTPTPHYLAAVLLGMGAMAPAAPDALVRLGSDRFRQAGRVEALADSADGKRLASVDSETIYLWDAATGQLLRSIPAPEDRKFIAVHFNADATAVFAVCLDKRKDSTLYEFDAGEGKVKAAALLQAADKDGFWDPEIVFSPAGAWVAARRGDRRELVVMNTATRKVAWSDRGTEEKFHAIAFRPDSGELASAGWDGVLTLIDLKTARVRHQHEVGKSALWNVAYSPDGKNLVVGIHAGGPIDLLGVEAATGRVGWKYRADTASSPFFTADGTAVVYFGPTEDRAAPDRWRWLNAATGEPTGRTFDTGTDWRTTALRPGGRALAVGGTDGHIAQWDLTTRKRLDAQSADPGSPVTELRFTPDGRKVRGWANGWYEWDVGSGGQARLGPDLERWRAGPVAVSDDQRWLARLRRADQQSPARLDLIGLPAGRDQKTELLMDFYTAVRFTPGGRLLVTDRGGWSVVDPATGKRTVRVATGAEPDMLAASGDGTTAVAAVAAGDHLRGARWDLTTGKSVAEWNARLPNPEMVGRSRNWQAELSPDGRLLAVSFVFVAFPGRGFDRIEEEHTALFDARTGRYLSGWFDFRFRSAVAFSPDGRTVALTYPGGGLGVEVRETVTGQRRLRSGPPATAAAFSADGRTLALATAPGPVTLWDLAGRPVGKWDGSNAGKLLDALAADDAEQAFNAIRVLRQHAAEAVTLLNERVKVPTTPEAAWVAERVKMLDAAQFRDREKATGELAAAGELVAPQLRAALKGASPEVHGRLEGLLEKVDVLTPDKLRAIRACEVLEGIGTADARELLATWAKGPAAATLTQEAAESFARLKAR